MGSPPHMQGKEMPKGLVHRAAGITPAYAGKRTLFFVHYANGRDHPRVCGEKRFLPPSLAFYGGSPPRMRGKVFKKTTGVLPKGITPAYAGKSLRLLGFPRSSQDHPRICGEKLMNISTPTALQGSPPRMRGKAGIAAGTCRAVRITPAYAGKSLHGKGRGGAAGDHPRICGEK